MVVNVKNNLPKGILMGEGALGNLVQHCPKGTKTKVMVVTDKGMIKTNVINQVKKLFTSIDIYSEISSEPTSQDLQKALDYSRSKKHDMILGIGGGSALDMAKVVAGLRDTDIEVKSALNQSLDNKRKLFFVAVPTTAGTGSEATLNSIIIDIEDGVKKAIISSAFLPDIAVLDPALTVTLPGHLTASTGVDALCHCLESLISVNASQMSEIYSRRGIQLILENIKRAVYNPTDIAARFALLVGSFCGGVALAMAGTTAVHALAYPLGKRGVPHGVSNSMLLLEIMKFNAKACEQKLLSLNTGSKTSEEFLDFLADIIKELPIPKKVKQFSITIDELDNLASEAMEQTRLLNNNPIPLTYGDVRKIYSTLF